MKRAHGVLAAAAGLVFMLAAPAAPRAEAIVGGVSTPKGLLGNLARIDLPDDVCSGSVVAPRLVLTALHCVQTPQDGVSPDDLGRRALVSVGNPNHGGRVEVRGVAGVFVAPQIVPSPPITHQVDAALLVLDRAVRASRLPIAPAGEVAALAAPGRPLLLAGFGASVSPPPTPDGRQQALSAGTILKHAALVGAACPAAAGAASPYVACASAAAEPLAGVPDGNSCAGDSGGPILAPSPATGGGAQIGILSGAEGVDTCSQTNTTIFTPIGDALTQWIVATAASELPAPKRPPKGCTRLRRQLRAAERSVARLSRHGRPGALRAARKSASRLATRVAARC
ncbi:MAG: Trypsin [Solirubrobacteraceae bacterium]|nr:Trypsin [Solirubrobacteraceae bacterium]